MQRFFKSLRSGTPDPRDGSGESSPHSGQSSPSTSPRVRTPRHSATQNSSMTFKLMKSTNRIRSKWATFSKLSSESEREICFKDVLLLFTSLYGVIDSERDQVPLRIHDVLNDYMTFFDIVCEKCAMVLKEKILLDEESFLNPETLFDPSKDEDGKKRATDALEVFSPKKISPEIPNLSVELLSAIYYFVKYNIEKEEIVLVLVGYSLHRYLVRILYWMSYRANAIIEGEFDYMRISSQIYFVCQILFQDRISSTGFVEKRLEILIPFRLACLRSPPRNIFSQKQGLVLIHSISRSGVDYPKTFENLHENGVVKFILDTLNGVIVEENEKPSLDHYALLWKELVWVIECSIDSSDHLLVEFEVNSGYEKLKNSLRVLIQMEMNQDEEGASAVATVLEATGELCYIGKAEETPPVLQRYDFDKKTGDLCIEDLPSECLMDGRMLKNTKAFGVLLELFLDSNQLPVQKDILLVLKSVFTEHPHNYYILLKMNALCQMIEHIEDLEEDLRGLVLELVPHVAFELKTVPLQEICSLIVHMHRDDLMDPLENPLLPIIIEIFKNMARRQKQYRQLLGRNGLFDIALKILRHHLQMLSFQKSTIVIQNNSFKVLEMLWNLILLLCEDTPVNFEMLISSLSGLENLYEYVKRSDSTKMALEILLKFLVLDPTLIPNNITRLFEVAIHSVLETKILILAGFGKLFQMYPNAQNEFREVDGFRNAICILSNLDSVSYSPHARLELIEAVLHMLPASVRDNEQNREELAQSLKLRSISDSIKLSGVIGNEKIGEEASSRIFQALYDIAIESTPTGFSFSYLRHDSSIVFNPYAILQIIWLIGDHTPIEPTVLIIGRIESLLQRNVRNLFELSEVECISEILEILENGDFYISRSTKRLQTALFRVLESLASFSISVRELIKMFSILRESSVDEKGPVLEKLKPMLLKSVSKVTGTTHYPSFFFDLRSLGHASLRVPCINCSEPHQVPAKHTALRTRTFSISLWVFIDVLDSDISLPLYSIQSSDNKLSIDAYIQGRKFQIKMLKSPVEFKRFSFQTGRWYHVVVSHKARKLASSSVQIYVDGFYKETRSVSMGSPGVAHLSFVMGTPRFMPRKSENAWRIGNVTFFRDELKPHTIVQLHALGHYSTKFNCTRMGSYSSPKSITLDHVISLGELTTDEIVQILTFQEGEGRLGDLLNSGKVVFSYVPFKANTNRLVGSKGDNQPKSKFHNFASTSGTPIAEMEGDVTYLRSCPLRSGIRHVGGVGCVLDLLLTSKTALNFCYALEILDNLLESPLFELDMQRNKGYQMLAHGLSIKWDLCSAESSNILFQMAGYNGKDLSSSIVSNLKLIQVVLLEYDNVWVKVSVSLQDQHFNQLASFVLGEGEYNGQGNSAQRARAIEFNKDRLRKIDIVNRLLLFVRHEKCPDSVTVILLNMLHVFFADGREGELRELASLVKDTASNEFYQQAGLRSDELRLNLRYRLLEEVQRTVEAVEDEKIITTVFDMDWLYFLIQSITGKRCAIKTVRILVTILMKNKTIIDGISKNYDYKTLGYLLPKFWQYEEVYSMLMTIVMNPEVQRGKASASAKAPHKLISRVDSMGSVSPDSPHLISSLLDKLLRDMRVSSNGDLSKCSPYYFEIILPIFDMLKRSLGIATPLACTSDEFTVLLDGESSPTSGPVEKLNRGRSPSFSSVAERKIKRPLKRRGSDASPSSSPFEHSNLRFSMSRGKRKTSVPHSFGTEVDGLSISMDRITAAYSNTQVSPPWMEGTEKERLMRLRSDISTSVVNMMTILFIESVEFRAAVEESSQVLERIIELLVCTHRDVGVNKAKEGSPLALSQQSSFYTECEWGSEHTKVSSEKLLLLLVEFCTHEMKNAKSFLVKEDVMRLVSPRATPAILKELHEKLLLQLVSRLHNEIYDNMLNNKKISRFCSNIASFCSSLADFSSLEPFHDLSFVSLDFVLFVCEKLDPLQFMRGSRSGVRQRSSSLSSFVHSTLSSLFDSLNSLILLHLMEYSRRDDVAVVSEPAGESDEGVGVGLLQKLLDKQEVVFSTNNNHFSFLDALGGYLLSILDRSYSKKSRLRHICLDLWKLVLLSCLHAPDSVLASISHPDPSQLEHNGSDFPLIVSGFSLLLEGNHESFLNWYTAERERTQRFFRETLTRKKLESEDVVVEKIGELQRFYFNETVVKIDGARRREMEEFQRQRGELESRLLVEHERHHRMMRRLREIRRRNTERFTSLFPRDWMRWKLQLRAVSSFVADSGTPGSSPSVDLSLEAEENGSRGGPWLFSSREGRFRMRRIIQERDLPFLGVERQLLKRSHQIVAETNINDRQSRYVTRSAILVTKTPRGPRKDSMQNRSWRMLEEEFDESEGDGEGNSTDDGVKSVEEVEEEKKIMKSFNEAAGDFDFGEESDIEIGITGEDEELDLNDEISLAGIGESEAVKGYNCGIVRGMDKTEALLVLGQKRALLWDGVTMVATGAISFADSFDERSTTYAEEIRKISGGYSGSTLQFSYREITEVMRCRYLHVNCSLEIFLEEGVTHFLVFNMEDVEEVYSLLVSKLREGLGSNFLSRFIFNRDDLEKYTTLWKMGEISNFEYLSILNTYSGRSFNDLQQYPVFPWVLQDYSSENLDLSSDDTYRDLSKPMGALDEERALLFRERFDLWEDKEVPPFHYGTHHSSAAIVLYYLLRLEPFSTDSVLFQGGRFDHSDRIFSNIAGSYESASATNMSDVKELIPEFYYLPYFLVNLNSLDFGRKQTGESVEDVILPKWAHGDSRYFVMKMREALESPYTSANLHNWIDLIFGFKQSGKEAEEALNVFYYLTYEGSINIDEIRDPSQRESVVAQISNFGQTPKRLFSRPHPHRQVLTKKIVLFDEPEIVVLVELIKELQFVCSGIVFSGSESRPKFFLERRFIHRNTTQHVLSFGSFDNTLRVSDVENIQKPFHVHDPLHHGIVLSADFSEDGRILAIGGRDTIISIWNVNNKRHSYSLEPRGVLCGHVDDITTLCVSRQWRTVASGSKDQTMKIWDLETLSIAHSYSYTSSVIRVDILQSTGAFICCTSQRIFGYDACGVPLFFHEFGGGISSYAVSEASLHSPSNVVLATGHSTGEVRIWNVDFDNGPVFGTLDEGEGELLRRRDIASFLRGAAAFKVGVYPLILRSEVTCSNDNIVFIAPSPCYKKFYVGTEDKKVFAIIAPEADS